MAAAVGAAGSRAGIFNRAAASVPGGAVAAGGATAGGMIFAATAAVRGSRASGR